jgi:hypothetical protein
MTERPCGDPATEQIHRQSTHDAGSEVEADEIFSARKKIGKPPASPELIDSRGIPPSVDPAPAQTTSH